MSGRLSPRPAATDTDDIGQEIAANEPISETMDESSGMSSTSPHEAQATGPDQSQPGEGGSVVTTDHRSAQTIEFIREQVPKVVPSHVNERSDASQMMLRSALTDYKTQTITDYLGRSVLMGTVTWSASDKSCTDILDYKDSGELSPLISFNLPHDFIAGGSLKTTQVYDKIKNFAGLRCDWVFTFVVNAQRFQAGILRASVYPMPDMSPLRYNLSIASGQSISQLPGVLIDISKDKVSELTFKAGGPVLFYDILSDSPQFHRLDLWAYSKLLDASNESVSISIYAEMTNVRLQHATPALPSIPEPVPSTTTFKPYINSKRYGTSADAEASKPAQSGDISSVASTIGKVSGMLSMIPGVGQFAAPVSMLANTTAGIASAFGHSKPTSHQPQQKFQPYVGSSFVTTDGDYIAHNLSMTELNAIKSEAHTTSSKDEMTLAYIAARPALVQSFAWSTGDSTHKVLFKCDVSPFGNTASAIRNNKAIFLMSPMAFVAASANLWRGDITYDFTIVKTNFHSGTLRIGHTMFAPVSYWTNSEGFNTPDLNKLPAKIWKIDESNTFSYTVPFGSALQWKPSASVIDLEVNTSAVSSSSVGTLLVTVEIPLVAASTVTPTIEILVHERMERNCQFAIPNKPNMVPMYYSLSNSYKTGKTSKFTISSGSIVTTNKLWAKTIQDNKPSHITSYGTPGVYSTTAEETCIGEVYKSCAQVIKRKYPMGTAVGGIFMQPNGLVLTGKVSDDLPIPETDYIYQWQSLFMYRAGGIQLSVIPLDFYDGFVLQDMIYCQGVPFPPITFADMIDSNHTDATNWFTYHYLDDSETAYVEDLAAVMLPVVTKIEGMAQFEVPYYSDTHVVVNELLDQDVSYTSMGTGAMYTYPRVPKFLLTITNPYTDFDKANHIAFFRSARDDFVFNHFLGVPAYISASDNAPSTSYKAQMRAPQKVRPVQSLTDTQKGVPTLLKRPQPTVTSRSGALQTAYRMFSNQRMRSKYDKSECEDRDHEYPDGPIKETRKNQGNDMLYSLDRDKGSTEV